MTKTLGSAALQLYAGVVSMFLPISAENQPGLIADLEGDPFVGHALSSATCELYHRYGMFLAPLTAALTTIKHCQFGHRCPAVINDGNQAEEESPQAVPVEQPAETVSQAAKDSLRPPVSAADIDGTFTCVCLCGLRPRKYALASKSRICGGRPHAQSPG